MKKGFTLVEVMIVGTIVAIVTLFIVAAVNTGFGDGNVLEDCDAHSRLIYVEPRVFGDPYLAFQTYMCEDDMPCGWQTTREYDVTVEGRGAAYAFCRSLHR